MKQSLILFVLTASLAAAAGNATAGKTAYDAKCKSCHGADGTPNPSIAKMMKVDMRALGSADVQKQSDADIKGIITNGKGKMKGISGVNADDVIAYVRSLKK
jgi:mono/diheme cytochrome c family protein